MAQVYPGLDTSNVEDNYDFTEDLRTEYSTDAFGGTPHIGDMNGGDLGWVLGWPDEDATFTSLAKRRVADLRTDNGTMVLAARSTVPNLGHVSMTKGIEFPGPSTACVPMQYSPNMGSLFTEILELFPDISPPHVEDLITRYRDNVTLPGPMVSQERLQILHFTIKEMVVEEILANPSYPTRKQLKRKRDEVSQRESGNKKWETATYDGNAMYQTAASTSLSEAFPHVPVNYIRHVLKEKKNLYRAFLALSVEQNEPASARPPYERLKRARIQRYRDGRTPLYHLPVWGQVQAELEAAKAKLANDIKAARAQKEQEDAEKENEQQHTRAGTLLECQCCYADIPPNRAIACEAAEIHFFCYLCIRKSAETQIGMMKYQVQCFDTSGCQAEFTRSELAEVLGSPMMEKLDMLQQQDEVTRAGIEGLAACPFCEFKAICPPVAEDREFRCYNPSCEIVSCRLCNETTHVPKSCEEARKERGISERHQVEEAMSEALIRSCPQCQVKIVKEFGCNKMTCSKCRCVMCYVCKKDISRQQYAHFGRGPNTCRVDDDPTRDQRAIEQAEKTTIDKIRAENPGLTQEELQIRRPEPTTSNRKRDRGRAGIDQVPEAPLALPRPPVQVRRVHHHHRGELDQVRPRIDNRHGLLEVNAAQIPPPDPNVIIPNEYNYIPPINQHQHPIWPFAPPVNPTAEPTNNGPAVMQPAGTGGRDDPFVIDDNEQSPHRNAPAVYAEPLAGYMTAPAQPYYLPPVPYHAAHAHAYAYPFPPQQPFSPSRNSFLPF